MRHVFVRPRLKLAAVLPITILWFVFAGQANAAAPPTGTIDNTNPMTSSTSWQGNLYATSNPLLASDPTLCGPTSANDGNCDHFELTTNQTGPVRVVVTWPGSTCATLGTCAPAANNDFDLLVCLLDPAADATELLNGTPDECAGGTAVVPFCTSNRTAFEECDFPAIGGKTYEIRVLPVLIDMFGGGTDYNGCAEYTDVNNTASNCAAAPIVTPPPVGAADFAQGCPAEASLTPMQRQVDGGGKLPAAQSPNGTGNFNINVRRHFDSNGKLHFRGKVNYNEDGSFHFKSKNATCATFVDGANTPDSDHSTTFRGKVIVRGFGEYQQGNNDPPACYEAEGDDWGQPGAGKDQFHIKIFALTTDAQGNQICSATPIKTNDGVITDGNIKYKFQPVGKDE